MRIVRNGITVFYDTISKSLFMSYGDEFEYLSGPFETQAKAFSAGDERCQKLGWIFSRISDDAEAVALI